MNAIYLLSTDSYEKIYGEPERIDISRLVDICGPTQTAETIAVNPDVLNEVDVILSGWGCARMDEEFLRHAPRLKIVLYGAGSVKGFVTDAFWERGICLVGGWAANAVPVAEYVLSQILFCLKHGWQFALRIRDEGMYPQCWNVPGAYDSTVGIISLGQTGRKTAELLRPFDLEVLAYDPFVSPKDAAGLKLTMRSLEEIFERSDVVSLHTPNLPETQGMIRGEHFEAMKPGATFINSGRGAVVREDEMIEVLSRRPEDLFAVLDVTHPEPPAVGSPLYTLPNVVLTPHMAGAMSSECRRNGRYMVEELERFLDDRPLRYEIKREHVARLA